MKSITTFSMGWNKKPLETYYISGNNYARIQSIAEQYREKMGYSFSTSKYIQFYKDRSISKLTVINNQFKKGEI